MRTLMLLILVAGFAKAQTVYSSTKAHVKFFSESPLEDIEADNEKARSLISEKDSAIVVSIPNIAFKFEKPLMEEHFHENYMETEDFPKSMFKGKIVSGMNFQQDGTYEVQVEGQLTIHGVTLDRQLTATIVKAGDVLTVKGSFLVRIEEHDVKVPSMYIDNIAEEVTVFVDFTYEPYKK